MSQSIFERIFRKEISWEELIVEPTGDNEFGPCSCCGNMSKTVWGFVHHGKKTLAAYFVSWTQNKPEHDVSFDLLIGEWGKKANEKQKKAVSLVYRLSENSLMVIDAKDRPIANNELVGKVLKREDVIGQPLAQTVFSIVDAVFLRDERIREIIPA